MSRGPPHSSLFPYTTLFRSHDGRELDRPLARHGAEADLAVVLADVGERTDPVQIHERCRPGQAALVDLRSEEHTSELQSLTNLVCRLLLEKKKHCDSRHQAD